MVFELDEWIDEIVSEVRRRLWDWVDTIAKYWVRNINLVSGALDNIKTNLSSWVDTKAETAVKNAYNWFDILNYKWSDVKELVDDVEDYVSETSRDLWREIDEIDKIVGETWNEFIEKIEDAISDIIKDLETRIDYVREWINNADNWWVSQLDKQKDKLEDIITERFEKILDRIFE